MSGQKQADSDTKKKKLSRGEKTRQKILYAAEATFAKDGFDAARMEDIANEVGIKRAGLFYYYKDKQALYQAMLENVMAELTEAIKQQVNPDIPLQQQIENCAIAWVDFVWHKPGFVKILLREGVKPSDWMQQEISQFAFPLIDLLQELLEKANKKAGSHSTINALHIASTLAGATVFSISVFPALISDLEFSQADNEQLQLHKENIRKLTRLLLSDSY